MTSGVLFRMRAELARAVIGAARGLVRAPAFTLTALVSLAFGVAVNTAAFAFLDATVLRPPPFSDPDALYVFHDPRATTRLLDDAEAATVSRLPLLGAAGAYRAGVAGRYTIGVEAAGSRFEGLGMSTAAFRALGVRPQFGRLFAPEEEDAGAPVIVVSHELWERALDGDSAMIGKALRVGGVPHVVVGVMPRGFAFPFDDSGFWLPLRDPAVAASPRSLSLVARLAPNVGRERLFTMLRSKPLYSVGAEDTLWIDATSLADARRFTDAGALYAMQIAVALVFLVACVNISNLVLSRALARRAEIALRLALGAPISALATDAIAETALLAIVATVVGGAGAALLLTILARVVPPGQFQFAVDAGLSWRALAYTTGCMGVALAVMSLAPALYARRADLRVLLANRAGGRAARSGGRWRAAFVVVQLALSLLLLTDTVVMVRLLRRTHVWETGIDASSAVRADVRRADGAEPASVWFERLHAAGAQAAGASAPLRIGSGTVAAAENERSAVCACSRVTSEYLAALGARIVSGRDFGSADRAADGLVVVDSVLAAQLWPDGGALGRTLRFGDVGQATGIAAARVVGIVRPIQFAPPPARRAGQRRIGAAYLLSSLDTVRNVVLVTRGRVTPSGVRASFTRTAGLDAQRIVTLDAFLALATRAFKWYATVFGALAGLATALAVIGLYGVVSYATTQREHEIGIRLALGATPGAVRRLVLGDTTRLVLVGIVAGAGSALLTVGVLRSAVPGVTTDSAAAAGAVSAALLALVAIGASAAPALDASRQEPAELLRR